MAAASGIECIRSSFIVGEKLINQAASASSSSSFSCCSFRSKGRRLVVSSATTALDSHLVLGLDHSASKQEIKRAYRNLALQYHPDVCKGNEHVFTQINLAYECLMNDFKGQSTQHFSESCEQKQDEWLSEGYTFEEIFGCQSPFYEAVDESLFQHVKSPKPVRKTNGKKKKSSCMREDW